MQHIVQPRRLPEPIVLAREPDIDLGPLVIRPSAREVVCGETVVALEPRVMQVLVALVRPPGAVVSRDDLIERCWEGRIVGDDAITRCIGALRKLARGCADAFEIETLPKIGYRLALREHADKQEHAAVEADVGASSAAAVDELPDTDKKPAPTNRLPRPFAMWAGGAIGVVCGAFAVAILFATDILTPPKDSWGWTVDEVRSFASSPVAEREPALSSDARLVAFARGPSHHRNIFVQALNSADAFQMTTDDQSVGRGIDKSAPVWSPDGSQVAYLIRPDDTPCRIAVQPFPKGTAREVGRCVGATKGRLVWMPQGDALIHVDRLAPSGPYSLMKLDLKSGVSVALTKPPDGNGDSGAVVSPDGNYLVFIREGEGKPLELNLMDLRSRSLRVLRTGAGFITGAWSEDSTTIFFVELGNDHELRLKAMRLADGRTDDLYMFPGSNSDRR